MAKKKPDLAELAGALVQFWSADGPQEITDVWKKRSVDSSDVVAGLRSLVASGDLSLTALAGVASLDARVGLAIEAIKVVQRFGGLKVIDGILGRKTRSAMKSFRSCNDTTKSNKAVTGAGKGMSGLGVLFFHIQPKLASRAIPTASGGSETAQFVIGNALDAWIIGGKLNLVTQFVDDPSDANVLVVQENIDGPGNTTGIAHIGGKGIEQQLTCRFDENEEWNEAMFLNTATHELGHILGLTHEPGPGHIMSAFQDLSVKHPTPRDLERMQTEWGVK
ncbi:MAG: matrixin family metalloprotease [Pirellulaceae bacterium]|jgi:hypothetical protein|nr:matrixin family metalloprotease [Pirellulaceae bacterium]MDP7019606.1 matrixin family metalloprotease [Pirellulaceae bacterium]